ncbi:hypothetical protein MtrunA17_Chr1g0147441 [Medicago truncatula]|uniref:Uncharacterized protein n=1 Tax=Medicago truncatula TaxID=3880 RepID=A0A396JKD9_MEDTR|nr:hypothetical protein MtrunA17_Chr1g0147441 [Medicago truncatula]
MTFISSTFRPSKTTNHHHHPPPSHPNLTTYIYQTNACTISLTWSRSILDHTIKFIFKITLPSSNFT